MQYSESRAKTIQEHLKSHGIKQVFLAEKIGVSPKRLSDMLCGKLVMPDKVFEGAVRLPIETWWNLEKIAEGALKN